MFTKASRATRYGSIFTNQVDKIMKTAKYIIIDIETLGRRNDAAVTQVGIVIADENFDVLDSYLIQVTPNAWNTCDRTFTEKLYSGGWSKRTLQ